MLRKYLDIWKKSVDVLSSCLGQKYFTVVPINALQVVYELLIAHRVFSAAKAQNTTHRTQTSGYTCKIKEERILSKYLYNCKRLVDVFSSCLVPKYFTVVLNSTSQLVNELLISQRVFSAEETQNICKRQGMFAS